MTLNEYQRLAARTANMDVSPAIQRATFALGLVCEATEVLDASPGKLLKELGDVMWYAAGLCTLFDLRLGQVAPRADRAQGRKLSEQEVSKTTLVIAAGDTSDYLKKVIGHGHDLDRPRLVSSLKNVVETVHDLARDYGITLENVCEANIAKLKARYPDGFSTQDSIHRRV